MMFQWRCMGRFEGGFWAIICVSCLFVVGYFVVVLLALFGAPPKTNKVRIWQRTPRIPERRLRSWPCHGLLWGCVLQLRFARQPQGHL